MERKENVFLIGAGDHAKVVLSTLEACNIGCAGIYDDNPKLWGKSLWCIPILGPVSDMPDTPETMAIIAIGSNEVRRRMAARFKNVCWPALVHPLGIVNSSVRLGEGTIIFAGCIVESDAVIGKHTIVNSACFIGHDTHVGSFCHLGARSAPTSSSAWARWSSPTSTSAATCSSAWAAPCSRTSPSAAPTSARPRAR